MFLDIIIPQFRETEEQLRPLLTMLSMQRLVNRDQFRVTIVNGHSDIRPSAAFLCAFPNIDLHFEITDEDKGPGYNRQWGIDHTDGEYIMFIDADDNLFSVTTLAQVITFIKEHPNFECYKGGFFEEVSCREGLFLHHHRDGGYIWLHGKVWQRAAIEQRHAAFPCTFSAEDTYFNIVMLAGLKNSISMGFDCYVWQHNNTSVTRSLAENYSLMKGVESMRTIISAGYRIACDGRADGKGVILSALVNAYYILQEGPASLPENAQFVAALEKDWWNQYVRFGFLLEELGDRLNEILEVQLKAAKRRGLEEVKESFEDFCWRLHDKYATDGQKRPEVK